MSKSYGFGSVHWDSYVDGITACFNASLNHDDDTLAAGSAATAAAAAL